MLVKCVGTVTLNGMQRQLYGGSRMEVYSAMDILTQEAERLGWKVSSPMLRIEQYSEVTGQLVSSVVTHGEAGLQVIK